MLILLIESFCRVERSLPSKLVDPNIEGKAEDKNKHEDVYLMSLGSLSQKADVTQFQKLFSFQPLNVKCRWLVLAVVSRSLLNKQH